MVILLKGITQKKRFLYMAAIPILTIALFFTANFLCKGFLIKRAKHMLDREIAISMTGRINQLSDGIGIFRKYPFMGVGVGTLKFPDTAKKLRRVSRNVAGAGMHKGYATSIENNYIRQLAETGIVGALGLFTFVIISLWLPLQRYRRSIDIRYLWSFLVLFIIFSGGFFFGEVILFVRTGVVLCLFLVLSRMDVEPFSPKFA